MTPLGDPCLGGSPMSEPVNGFARVGASVTGGRVLVVLVCVSVWVAILYFYDGSEYIVSVECPSKILGYRVGSQPKLPYSISRDVFLDCVELTDA